MNSNMNNNPNMNQNFNSNMNQSNNNFQNTTQTNNDNYYQATNQRNNNTIQNQNEEIDMSGFGRRPQLDIEDWNLNIDVDFAGKVFKKVRCHVGYTKDRPNNKRAIIVPFAVAKTC